MEQKKGTVNGKIIAAAVCLAAAAAALFLVWRFLTPQGEAGAKTVVVEVVHKDGSARKFSLNTDADSLGKALVESGVVVDNQDTYGLYILTADGETADESKQEWWQITKNGVSLTTSADSTPITDGEHYELTLTVGWS